MANESEAYLGRGWSFPPSFDIASKGVQMVSAEEDICQSLEILLSTSLGERVVQPTYGCNLRDLQFEPLNASVSSYFKELVRTAILYHEPRIRVQRLELTQTPEEEWEGILKFEIDYLIISTNSRFNFVYPFYLNEGTRNP